MVLWSHDCKRLSVILFLKHPRGAREKGRRARAHVRMTVGRTVDGKIGGGKIIHASSIAKIFSDDEVHRRYCGSTSSFLHATMRHSHAAAVLRHLRIREIAEEWREKFSNVFIPDSYLKSQGNARNRELFPLNETTTTTTHRLAVKECQEDDKTW